MITHDHYLYDLTSHEMPARASDEAVQARAAADRRTAAETCANMTDLMVAVNERLSVLRGEMRPELQPLRRCETAQSVKPA